MNDEPDDELIREVYARFGLAYYLSESLHREVCVVLAYSELPARHLITRPRVEERLAQAFSLTLGDVATKLEGVLPAGLSDELRVAVEVRNFLAHHFWFERAHLMFRVPDLRKLIMELDECSGRFERLDNSITRWAEPLRLELGITDEVIQANLQQILAGESEEPLPDRQTVKERDRKLTRRQRLMRVWELTLEDGKKPLIFELADGSLWQLSDVGLGWTGYREVGLDWIEHPTLGPHLPADILPRPVSVSPWEYEFTLAKGVVLWVKPGNRPQTFKWGVQLPEHYGQGQFILRECSHLKDVPSHTHLSLHQAPT